MQLIRLPFGCTIEDIVIGHALAKGARIIFVAITFKKNDKFFVKSNKFKY